ncbi:MAG: urate hydroxylase PuuD [Gammaproteobacteria bacterium]|nr:urate hydroxylase PuuD [Gammaproteobacteria bacterium]MCY4165277.1 urate hydroxylase PuuD [Gammaproteobacteria bacterium]MCY4256235.1 urate hydroxylase PuuD [Gammaproteobacteria bacterium]
MNPLNTLTGTLVGGLVLSLVIMGIAAGTGSSMAGANWVNSMLIWLHVFAGITWIGLLYYFNFVQVQALADAASDDDGPSGAAITRYVAPRALWWFRWSALVTWLAGATFLLHKGDFINAFTLGLVAGGGDAMYGLTIGIGAWLGSIMLFNVWFVIWPNQKRVLGIVEASAEEINKSRRTAFVFSRTNTLLSIPMLASMIGAGHGTMF